MRYTSIARSIEDQIKAGQLLAGQRLPSVREMSAFEKTSPTTVVQAYELLLDRGLIEARARSGFYVADTGRLALPPEVLPDFALLREPAALSPGDLVFALRQATRDPKILPLGAATPASSFYPYKAVSRALAKTLREEPALATEYTYPPGSLYLRREIARRYARSGVKTDAAAIVTTTGATEAVALALQAVARPGDVVMIESPTYFGLIQLLRTLGFQILEVPTHPERGLEPDRFIEAVQRLKGKVKAAVLVPNHSNPWGSCMPDVAKAELVTLASREQVALIEDDAYGELTFGPTRPKPLLAFDVDQTVILCGTFAKTASPGLRVGYAISSQWAAAIAARRSAMVSGAAVVAEETLARLLAEGAFDRHLRRVRKEYQTLVARFASAIVRSFPEGTRVSQPSGGYILWVQLPGGVDSREVQKAALAQKISVASGALFSAQGAYGDCLRINCATPWSERIERGIARLGQIVSARISS